MKKLMIALFGATIFLSCSKPCIESRGIEGAGLTITFLNSANNEYLYPENTITYPSPFKLDSLRVKDSQGHLLTTPYQRNAESVPPFKAYYIVDIYPIFIPESDQAAFDKEQIKSIYIRYNYTTYDTLKLVFKASNEKCANKYEYLKAYYKNNLIAETYNTYSQGLSFTLKH